MLFILIQSKPTDVEQKQALIEILSRRSCENFQYFSVAMALSNQEEILEEYFKINSVPSAQVLHGLLPPEMSGRTASIIAMTL